MTRQPTVLFVDAYDSFSENITALLSQLLDVNLTSIKIDCDIESEFKLDSKFFFENFDAIVLGPGPGNPKNAADTGVFADVWRHAAAANIPVLGVCLGFQSLCWTYGLPVIRMDMPCHGHAKHIRHCDQDIFVDVGEIIATCYNSLAVCVNASWSGFSRSRPSSSHSSESLISNANTPSDTSSVSGVSSRMEKSLKILAWDDEDHVMAVKHVEYPFWGVQFHPESCKSNEACHALLRQWWTAVQHHNQQLRRSRTIQERNFSVNNSSRRNHSASSGYTDLMDRLSHLTSSLDSCVRSGSICGTFDRKMIANMCLQLSQAGSTAMLESTKKGRFSIYTFADEATWSLEFKNGQCTLLQAGRQLYNISLDTHEMTGLLENFLLSRKIVKGNPKIPFWGGFVGFMSYEMGTDFLNLESSSKAKFQRQVPECSFLWVERSMVIDHEQGRAVVQSIRKNDSIWINDIAAKLEDLNSSLHENDECATQDVLSASNIRLPEHEIYVSQIRRCQEQLHAGNSYELCLTTEALVMTPSGPRNRWHLYNNLQKNNPAPFAAYLHLNDTTILSSSPEQFLSWSRTTGTFDMVPMKGTVKKVSGLTLADATAILATPKESAENLMIADLIRHDLHSTVGSTGTVEVAQLCAVVEHETVYQLVSHIRAHISLPSPHSIHSHRNTIIHHGHRALRHTLPPGSMTGAPKKRSCSILARLEQRPRGVYAGIIGFLDVGGGGSWSVCIRTAFSHASEDTAVNGEERKGTQTWHVGAGGAITVLSDEEKEWEEMSTKLDSVLRAFRPEERA